MAADRIVLSDVQPQLDGGRWPAKACAGDRVPVAVTIARDGHEVIRAVVRHKGPKGRWREEPLSPAESDRYVGSFPVEALGRHRFAVEAWVDRHAGWLDEVDRKVAAGQEDLAGELAEGEALFGPGALETWRAAAPALGSSERHDRTRSAVLEVEVERPLARTGVWYEAFPRSWGGLRGVAEIVPELSELGFDVLYLPPIHPIGETNRKGRNNAVKALPGDVGSPWAIGGAAGGHDAVHPDLGTQEDLEALVATARGHGMEIALDFAIQCSPDHPWLAAHPEWFERRPDGSIRFAENPPKRYQDIHNVDWDTPDAEGLWNALREVVLHWCRAGVRVFRVDNPHTKPVPFWEWLIAEVRASYPDTVFLSEAFTRPAMMTTLAKAGFSQSYTYFTWKVAKWDLVGFVEQLRSWSAFLRPNLWPNTPDILHESLVEGGRPAFESRLVLAATLSPSYGIYSGYESCENDPVRRDSEEYLDSEKYEVKHRRLEGPLLPLIARLNAVRRAHPALQHVEGLRWLDTADDGLLGYLRAWDADRVFVVVNLDPDGPRTGAVEVPPDLGLPHAFTVRDELTGLEWGWSVGRNYVRLDPGGSHVFTVVE